MLHSLLQFCFLLSFFFPLPPSLLLPMRPFRFRTDFYCCCRCYCFRLMCICLVVAYSHGLSLFLAPLYSFSLAGRRCTRSRFFLQYEIVHFIFDTECIEYNANNWPHSIYTVAVVTANGIVNCSYLEFENFIVNAFNDNCSTQTSPLIFDVQHTHTHTQFCRKV